MNKLPFYGMLSIPLSLCLFAQTVSSTEVKIMVDGDPVSSLEQMPYIHEQSGRTMIPARFVAERLGAKVEWNGQVKEVTIKYKDKTMILMVGAEQALINGKMIAVDTPAVIKNNRTMIPLRLVGEILQAKVDWNEERKLVVITTVPLQKGTWIWDSQIIKAKQAEIFAFARQNGLTTIYLHIDRDLSQSDYQDFIRNASSHNIQVEALAGKPYWAFKEHVPRIKEFITWVKAYNAVAGPNERFQGLHFDIEPYILQQWETENRLVLENWIESMRFIERETLGSGLKITLDVPFWIYKTKIPDSDYSFSSWLLEKFDCLVIMDYRNFSLGSNGIVSNASPILKEASNLNKQAIIAVETAPSTEGEHVTFYSLGTTFMDNELGIAKEELSYFSSFAGMAIHDYEHWTLLQGGIVK